KTIMYVGLQIASVLSFLSEPFLPFTSEKLKNILNVTPSAVEGPWNANPNLIPSGHQTNKSELLFSKIEDEQIQKQLDKLIASKKANEMENKSVAPQKPDASFEDFSKLDL